MKQLYEEGDLLHDPFQCFHCTTFPVAPHWHYYMEIIYVEKGALRIQVDNTNFVANTGEIVIFHPKSIHAFYQTDSECPVIAGIKLDINSMTFSTYYSPKLGGLFRSAEKKKEPIIIDSSYVHEMQLAILLKQCIVECENRDYGYDSIVFANLYRLLVHIVRYWRNHGFSLHVDSSVLEDNYDIFNILPYISSHLDQNLKVSELAEFCGLSYSYFAKRFQELYGKSCKAYIEDMRIHKVEELLLFTDYDLTYISQITGFSDCSHMIKSFKSTKGITPKQFRDGT